MGSGGLAAFVEEGRRLKESLLRCMPPGFEVRPGARWLDLGCGIGRLLYHLEAEARRAEIWGCDIDRASIAWLEAHLQPPFRFHCNAELPPLPFEDASFDLVVALSVFTHLVETWHEWLLEVRRILRPGGVALLSFLGRRPWTHLGGTLEEYAGLDFRVLGRERSWAVGGPLVFTSEAWIERSWSPVLALRAIFTEGLDGYQSVAVLEKAIPPPAAPVHRAQPFLFQVERDDFRGWVDFDPYDHASWWRSAGHRASAGDARGWLLSDHAPLARLWLETAGGRRLPLEPLARPDVAAQHPALPWAANCGFAIPIARACDAPGHRAIVRVHAEDRTGRGHTLTFQVTRDLT
jgi:SAM-dependent methyltransferase